MFLFNWKGVGMHYIKKSVKMELRNRMGGEQLAGRLEEEILREFEVPNRMNLKSSHHKEKIFCTYVR